MKVIIRPITIDDAESLWKMMFTLDSETKFMMYEPNERAENLSIIKSAIYKSVEGENLLLIAEANNEIVGYISAEKSSLRRIKHSAYIVVGIRSLYQNQGIGTQFFEYLDIWAKNRGVTRLELTVMCHNLVAKHLYEKNGFVVEGIKKHSMIVDGAYVNEYYMAKLM